MLGYLFLFFCIFENMEFQFDGIQKDQLRESSALSLIKIKRQSAQEKFKKAYGMSDEVYEKWMAEQNKSMREGGK